eukprot:gene15244-biopygen12711
MWWCGGGCPDRGPRKRGFAVGAHRGAARGLGTSVFRYFQGGAGPDLAIHVHQLAGAREAALSGVPCSGVPCSGVGRRGTCGLGRRGAVSPRLGRRPPSVRGHLPAPKAHWPLARARPCPPSPLCGRNGSGRGPDADRTVEFKETDTGRTRTGRGPCRFSLCAHNAWEAARSRRGAKVLRCTVRQRWAAGRSSAAGSWPTRKK